MMRYPKKNIAQRFMNKSKKPKQISEEESSKDSAEEQPLKLENIPKIPTVYIPPPAVVKPQDPLDKYSDDIVCYNAIWSDKLYPSKLWQIHNDLDKLTYYRKELSNEEIQEINDRLPGSLRQAEQYADKLLFKFVQDQVNLVGLEEYSKILQKAITPEVRILLALRCFIAASTNDSPPDSITIYRNKTLESKDFFPDSCMDTWTNPETGKEETYYTNQPQKDEQDKDSSDEDPYWRSSNHQSDKHSIATKLVQPDKSKRDKLPASFKEQMKSMLNKEFGIEVENLRDAWDQLDKISKDFSIETRILGRIAYLITNASVQHKTFRLDG